ncbi:MAG: putative metal-dependent hydrolase [Vicinamibacterales bacterium]
MSTTTDLRYPVGRLARKPTIDAAERAALIGQIEAMPARLSDALAGLSEAQLDTPYREGGWTVRQLVHHLADSHMNAFIRMRLAATEDAPALKTYDEKVWADLADTRSAPIASSQAILQGLHARWVFWLRALPEPDFARTAIHPQSGTVSIDTLLQIYGWHSLHHVAHITALRERQGW